MTANHVETEWRPVHELVRGHAEAHPDRVAIRDDTGRETTYGELLGRWRRLAGALRERGVGPERPVMVRLPRSTDLIVALLAVWESGGVYVPVDDSCPPGRFAAIVRQLGADVLVTDGPGAEGLAVVRPDDDGVPARPHAVCPDALAYVLHTSGSTGTPKGVAMTHRGLHRLIRWQIDDGPRALTTLYFTEPGFDVTFQEVLSTLATGGRLVLVAEQARRDPGQLLRALAEHSVQRVFLPYVALQQLAKAAQRSGTSPASLRHVITAGERLVVTEAIAALFAGLPDCRLDNHYGPTETHLVTSHPLPADRRNWPTFPSIGRPVSGAHVRLLDARLRPAPVGEEGEVYVGGPAVARGYVNAPEQTARRFVPDPFADQPGARMYHTGDLAWLDENGRYHFAGRVDDQVKVRGYRVEPAEVEIELAGHPAVADVAVGVRTLDEDVSVLVAYIVPDGPTPSVGELTGRLRDRLPHYLVPARFVFLDALPLGRSGKVDRKALASVPLPAAPAGPAGSVSLADTVSSVWQRVLGHDEFQPDDDFFDIGGDSMLAAWVVTELGQRVGRELDLSLLLADSTVAGLAERLSELDSQPTMGRRDSEILTLRAGPSNRALFLFHALGGELFGYRELVRAMSAPLRVLGVRWAGDADGVPASVPELAAAHVAQIRLVQPVGPYLLGGWSFGGVLAFEAARQLAAAGERVEFLGLLDGNPMRDPITGLLPADTDYFAMLTEVLGRIDARGAADDATVEVAELAGEKTWTDLMGTSADGSLNVRHLRRHLRVARNCMRAAMTYRPEPYPGDVELFHAADKPARLRELLAGELRAVVTGVVGEHDLPGDHGGMLTGTNAAALALAVDETLERRERSEAHGS